MFPDIILFDKNIFLIVIYFNAFHVNIYWKTLKIKEEDSFAAFIFLIKIIRLRTGMQFGHNAYLNSYLQNICQKF